MPRLMCNMPGGYSGFSEPGGGGRVVTVADGEVLEVSEEKAAQLAADFPDGFTVADEPGQGDAPPVERRSRKPRGRGA